MTNLSGEGACTDGRRQEDGSRVTSAGCFDGVLQVILELNERNLQLVSGSQQTKNKLFLGKHILLKGFLSWYHYFHF